MNFSLDDLSKAQQNGILDRDTHQRLVAFLAAEGGAASDQPRFGLLHVLWYAGALIVMAAMGLFTTLAFSALGGMALVYTGAAYALVAWFVGHRLWDRPGLRIPAGLLIAVAVSMVPMIVFGAQETAGVWSQGQPGAYRDYWHYVNGSWFWMSVGTIVASLLAVRRYPYGFILLTTAIAGWFLSMDLAPLLLKVAPSAVPYETRRVTSIGVGLVMLIIAYLVDLKRWRGGDMAFWLHLFGMMAFWGGVTASTSSTELQRFFYGLFNAGLIVLSAFLMRRVYAVFGAIGVSIYLGHLSWTVFKDSWAFPFLLSALGLVLIMAGVQLVKHRARIEGLIARVLPSQWAALRPVHARGGLTRSDEKSRA